MKTFVLILAMLAAPLAAQSPSTPISQTKAPSAAQQPQTVVKPTTKPAQPQPIVFTAKQLDEHGNKILDRSETFYNNRMTHLLWVMGIIMAVGGVIVGILIPVILERQRKRSFTKEMAARLQEFKEHSKEQTEELRTELTKGVSSNLSMLYAAIGGLLSSQEPQAAGYDLMLQPHILPMK